LKRIPPCDCCPAAFAAATMLQRRPTRQRCIGSLSASAHCPKGGYEFDLEPGNRTRYSGALGMVSSIIGITNPDSDVKLRRGSNTASTRRIAGQSTGGLSGFKRRPEVAAQCLSSSEIWSTATNSMPEFNPAIYDTFNPAPPKHGNRQSSCRRNSRQLRMSFRRTIFKFSPLLAGRPVRCLSAHSVLSERTNLPTWISSTLRESGVDLDL